MYGDSDWIDSSYAIKEIKGVNDTGMSHHPIVTFALNQGFLGSQSSIHILPHAGHHLYVENSDAFNKVVLGDSGSGVVVTQELVDRMKQREFSVS